MPKSTNVKKTYKKSSLKNKRKVKSKSNNRKQTKKIKRKNKSKSKSKSKSKRKVKTKRGGGDCLDCGSNNFRSYMEKLQKDLSGGGFDCNGTGYSVDPSSTILKEPVITKFD